MNNNILKVCDDKFCIEVFNVSNIPANNSCGSFVIYSSNQTLSSFANRDIWVIVVISFLSFLLLSVSITYISCRFVSKKRAVPKQKASDLPSKPQFECGTLRSEVSTYQYMAIPGKIGDSDNTFRFDNININGKTQTQPPPQHVQQEQDVDREESLSLTPPETKLATKNRLSFVYSKSSEETAEILIDTAFKTIRERNSNSNISADIHMDENHEMQHRSTIIQMDEDDMNDYQQISTQKSTFRRDCPYPAEYELNHLESVRAKNDNDIDSTQDDMIYKSTDNCYNINVGSVSPDDFERFSTIRLLKCFVPQEIKYYDIDFTEQEFIGSGCVGQVFKAKYNGIDVAVKKLNVKYLSLSARDLENFKREASLMQKVGGHKHIARMYGFCTAPEICIVTEYYLHGSLHDIIKKRKHCKQLSLQLKLEMCIDASLGILHLHQQNVIHGDISARNLLVDENWRVVVSDLGMSRLKQSKNNHRHHRKPIKWMAPESIITNEYTEKTDAYSFGITLYEIFSELEPYPHLLPKQAGVKVVTEQLRPQINHLQFVKQIPDLATLMKMLWKHESNQRPKFLRISQFLKKIKNKLE